MKKIMMILAMVIFSMTSKAQVYVNNVDLNKTVKMFELHMAIKPLTSKQCYYVDYGQEGFRENNYDILEKQAICDSTKTKFVKGEYLKLINYLDSQGWVKDSQRESKIGNVRVDIILFRKK